MSEPRGSSVTEDRGARLSHLAELMERVGAGDSAAFEALYEQVSPLVYGTAVKVLRNPELAAEVTQEVLVEVWRGAASFSPVGGSVPAWIATMAHRRAIDRVRAVQSQRERDERVGIRDYQPPQESVADEVERNLEQQQLQGCLETLTDLQRTAVYSAYYDGFTYREVADRAGAGLPTIKSRIRDGLKRLRECLEVLA